ncbi:diacylglycerol/polyprenol kinase family protein [Halovivax cerinus]|uniref:Diacylglycerol/polyprenol kinase family protein n=1 Tax=Halovivax cerinus TaxID=1487865 RepID=A0ABD5NSD3_9EURY|nr:dolichol kinase [Halovivax cerinus]
MADELKRRLVHASGSGLVALYLLAGVLSLGLTWQRFQWLVGLLAAGAVGLEVLRLLFGIEWWLFDKLTREYEAETVAGYVWYMVSMAVVVLVFSANIALPAMLMLSLGDPISGIISADSLQRVKDRRTLVGMFVLCAAIATPFLYEYPLAVLAAAFGATVADGVTVKRGDFVLDDNLTIPIYAGVAAWIAIQIGPFW